MDYHLVHEMHLPTGIGDAPASVRVSLMEGEEFLSVSKPPFSFQIKLSEPVAQELERAVARGRIQSAQQRVAKERS